MEFLTDIWTEFYTRIDWVICALVLAVGYGFRVTPYLKSWHIMTRIFIFGGLLTAGYAYLSALEAGKTVVSFFFCLGLHGGVLKYIEKRLGFGIKKQLKK